MRQRETERETRLTLGAGAGPGRGERAGAAAPRGQAGGRVLGPWGPRAGPRCGGRRGAPPLHARPAIGCGWWARRIWCTGGRS